LFPKSPDENVTTDIIYHHPSHGFAKVIVATVDLSQLSRQLWVVYQLLEAKFQVIVALTMQDVFNIDPTKVDVAKLEKIIGCPVVFVSGVTGQGTDYLIKKIQESRKTIPQKPVHIQPWDEKQKQHVLIQMKEVEKVVSAQHDLFQKQRQELFRRSERLDKIFLHPVWGMLTFVLLMFGFFSSIFWLAAPLMDLVDGFFSWAGDYVLALAPESLVGDFIGNGIIKSMGAVFVFVPQIIILFLGITLLEDTGYLARACSLIDKPLSKLGLNGRSFVPLLSGNACAIPAMMAARTISSPKEKFLTLFIVPLMSCSARLPVYALLLSFIFWEQPAWKAGMALAGIYFISLIVGGLAASIANRLIKFSSASFFIHELPLYRKPIFTTVLKSAFDKTMAYVKKAGPIIFVLAVIIWVGTTFPNHNAESEVERLETSYAAQLGQFIEPIVKPMGGDWRTGTALISAFAAREVFVSALSLVLNLSDTDEDTLQDSLLATMKEATTSDGTPLFTTASCVGLIIFFMIALQCMTTVAVARREFGNWKTPIAQLVIFNLVAYVFAVTAVQGLRALGIS
ncbi:MAG: ferrous iron transporter B, partial [Proteobacteria bacterium]|nr:ferrous iron transporter B [Pseudomonadota bacterium]